MEVNLLRRAQSSVIRTSAQERNALFTVSVNRALVQWDVETAKKVRCLRTAHDHSPYALCTLPMGGTRGQQVTVHLHLIKIEFYQS